MFLKKTFISLFISIFSFSYGYSQKDVTKEQDINVKEPARLDMCTIQNPEIREASGIEASSKNPGVFWTFNDSGGENKIFAFSTSGKYLGSYRIKGATNYDWEDIAIGPGKDENEQYIYIGDFGDNFHSRTSRVIYRIPEPHVDTLQAAVDTVISGVTSLIFNYPYEAKYNAEALMVDPVTNDLYVVTKDTVTMVFQTTQKNHFTSISDKTVNKLKYVAKLKFYSEANAADISDDGKEILIKDDNFVYYWKRMKSLRKTLRKAPEILPYITEPNGEGICWEPDGSGYYTFSEGLHPHLYFYPREIIDDNKKKK